MRAIAIAGTLLVGLWTSEPALKNFLPPSNAISGWQVYTAADRGAYTEKALYDLYDGEVPYLKKFGIKAAHQRLYKCGGKRVMVDLMRLDTWQHAKALYGDRTKGLSSVPGYRNLSGIPNAACIVATGGTATVYFWQRNYFCSVSITGTTQSDQSTAIKFAKYIAGKIYRHYHPRRK